MNDQFKYYLQRAVENLLISSGIDYKNNPVIAKQYIKNNIYTFVNNNLNEAIDNLLPK
jgi:hypothetical protein